MGRLLLDAFQLLQSGFRPFQSLLDGLQSPLSPMSGVLGLLYASQLLPGLMDGHHLLRLVLQLFLSMDLGEASLGWPIGQPFLLTNHASFRTLPFMFVIRNRRGL